VPVEADILRVSLEEIECSIVLVNVPLHYTFISGIVMLQPMLLIHGHLTQTAR
jgi:hypothetical protein